jgi:hypothetical protein
MVWQVTWSMAGDFELSDGYWQPVLAEEKYSRVADDASSVKSGLDRLARERKMSTDIDAASEEWLDMHGRRWGVVRNASEGDYSYRVRIKEVAK